MEIIEELEPTRRGPYTGSMGWIDYNGDMEFNIIIRTMVVKDERRAYSGGSRHRDRFRAGTGILGIPEQSEGAVEGDPVQRAVDDAERRRQSASELPKGETRMISGHR